MSYLLDYSPEFEVWRERRRDLLHEAEQRRLVRRLREGRKKERRTRTAAFLRARSFGDGAASGGTPGFSG